MVCWDGGGVWWYQTQTTGVTDMVVLVDVGGGGGGAYYQGVPFPVEGEPNGTTLVVVEVVVVELLTSKCSGGRWWIWIVVRYKIGSVGTAKATGGAISFYNGKTIHTFVQSGTFAINAGFTMKTLNTL